MPNIANIRKWVNALESGVYSQCRMRLKKDGGYCCLGVATDLFAKTHGMPFEEAKSDSGTERENYLSRRVAKWLGFGKNSKGYIYATMNDEKGMSFKDIAKYLRKKYLTKKPSHAG